jgi:hypothetical protein
MIPWAITVFTVTLSLSLLLLSASRMARRDEQIAQYAAMYRAARWLSQFNYSRLATLQEVASMKLGLPFGALRRMVDDEAARRPWFYTAQTIPLDAVPVELRQAAEEYNRSVFKDWPPRYAEPTRGWVETASTRQIRTLEEVLLVVTRVPSDDVLRDVACTVGTSYQVAEAVANALYGRAAYDVQRLTQPDETMAEELLPSV